MILHPKSVLMHGALMWLATIVHLALGIDRCEAQHKSELFSLRTQDGAANLNGQVDWHIAAPQKSQPVAVLLPGTGLFNRDASFGRTNTDADMIFLQIKNALVDAGIRVVRFDYRGVNCSGRAPASAACIDSKIRKTVTAANIAEDFHTVIMHAKSIADGAPLIAIAHSEGTLHLGRLLGKEPSLVTAALLIGPVLESPASIYKWQVIDRRLQWLEAMREPNAETISADVIRREFGRSPISSLGPIGAVLPINGAWTRQQLQVQKNEAIARYDEQRRVAIQASSSASFPEGSRIVQASYDWWKMWFTDDQPVANDYRKFSGPIALLFGEFDTQVDHKRQLKAWSEANSNPDRTLVRVFPNFGHALGQDGLLGPVADEALKAIAEISKEFAQSTAKP